MSNWINRLKEKTIHICHGLKSDKSNILSVNVFKPSSPVNQHFYGLQATRYKQKAVNNVHCQ